jgi:hypothetical protein
MLCSLESLEILLALSPAPARCSGHGISWLAFFSSILLGFRQRHEHAV